MKKSLLLVFLMSAVMSAVSAQEYKPVKVGLGFGYASPGGEGSKGGVLLYLEPAYRVNDQIAVGLRIESAVMLRGVVSDDGTSVSGSASANGSYSLTGQYYFSNATFRPFAGLGVGLFTLASVDFDTSSSSSSGQAAASTSELGFFPRVGFDLGHFTMQLEYNIIPSTKPDVVVSSGDPVEIKNSYLGIKFGFFVSGGKK